MRLLLFLVVALLIFNEIGGAKKKKKKKNKKEKDNYKVDESDTSLSWSSWDQEIWNYWGGDSWSAYGLNSWSSWESSFSWSSYESSWNMVDSWQGVNWSELMLGDDITQITWSSWDSDYWSNWETDWSSLNTWSNWETDWSSLDTWASNWDLDSWSAALGNNWMWTSWGDVSPDGSDWGDSFSSSWEDSFSSSDSDWSWSVWSMWGSDFWTWTEVSSWSEVESSESDADAGYDTWSRWANWDTHWADMSAWSSWGAFELMNIDNYWTNATNSAWCRDDYVPDKVVDESWADLMTEFAESGELTNWCIAAGQVFVVTDLRNVDLEDPDTLPAIFREVDSPCTTRVCNRHLEKTKIRDPDSLLKTVWGFIEVFGNMNCTECFCRDLGMVEAVLDTTAYHLKHNKLLAYDTTETAPPAVRTYFRGLKEAAGVGESQSKRIFRKLETMQDVTEGPGRIARQIQRIMETSQAVLALCS